MGVYKVFNISDSDLTLLFYRVYLCLILVDIRIQETRNKHTCGYFKL